MTIASKWSGQVSFSKSYLYSEDCSESQHSLNSKNNEIPVSSRLVEFTASLKPDSS